MDQTKPFNMAALNALMRPARVCICRNVSEQQIRSAVSGGADSFEQVQSITRCSTGCGTCEARVRAIIADELNQPGH